MSAPIQSGFFEEAYRTGTPPWDIGRPQPEVVRLVARGGFRGFVLDVGCGTGENALLVAAAGLFVTGLDGSPTAIEAARRKAHERGIGADFLVGDALELDRLGRRFDTVLDCGLLHVFSDGERVRYAASLEAAVVPGGLVHVLCFSDAEPPGWGPRRIPEAELRTALGPSFTLEAHRATRFASQASEDGARAWLASYRRGEAPPAGRPGARRR